MKLSTTFKHAYLLIYSDVEDYSCDAILRASGGKAPGALLWYREHFTPAVDSPEHYWLRGTEMSATECRAWRLTALAFAAALTKAEKL
jgi:hypothetical protein